MASPVELTWLDPRDDAQPFPNPHQALEHPNGLLAVGGNLSPRRLLNAYRLGIFPWYSEGQPILWWSPQPRTLLFPEHIKIHRSLKKVIKKQMFKVTLDRAFREVIEGCAAPRSDEEGTWITVDMQAAYRRLHQLGYAHSVEVWQSTEGHSQLCGGLYGVALGTVFFGESMFSRVTDSSKVALVALCQQLQRWQFTVIDCQMHTDHLARLGAISLNRGDFMALLEQGCVQPRRIGPWQLDGDLPIPELPEK